jgi:hypothetical protein
MTWSEEVKNINHQAGMVVQAYNLSNQEAEAGGSQIQVQPGLHNKTQSPKSKNYHNY